MPARASLEALGEARRIASFVGATLYAVLPCVTPPTYGEHDVIAELGRHGADKVVVVTGPTLGEPVLFASHGQAAAAACEEVPPALILLAATPGGRDLAPRLAARLGAALISEPSIEFGPRGELVFSRLVHGRRYRRRIAVDDLERPAVATLTAGSYFASPASDDAEVLALGASIQAYQLQEIGRSPDPFAPLDSAEVVVCAGAGVSPEVFRLLADLARALGGELAVTRSAAVRGLAPLDRVVGITGRAVSPRLYLAFGASGSPGHLLAIAPDTTIVAINRDPAAPILRSATYGLVADVGSAAAELLASLKPGHGCSIPSRSTLPAPPADGARGAKGVAR